MSIPDELTFSIAVLGAVLGIINTWKSFDRDKHKLTVIPKGFTNLPQGVLTNSNSDGTTGEMKGICIEVVNRSAFALTISEVGLLLSDKKRAVFSQHVLIDGTMLPKRIEPHHSVTIYSLHPVAKMTEILIEANRAYVLTDSGVLKKGVSPFFASILKKAKKRKTGSVSQAGSGE